MKADDAAETFDDVYSKDVDRRGSFNLASEGMGRDRNYLREQVGAPGGVRVRDALRSAEALGDPVPAETFHTAFYRLDADPAAYLEAAREPQPMASDLFFREMAPRLAALACAGASPGGEWHSRARKIEKLENLRRQDRQVARERLNQLIAGLVERLEKKGERPRKGLGELAAALGVLASLQRYAGRRGDALDLLLAARPLSLLAANHVAEGDWLVKAALLLVDLNRNARAYDFVLEASDLYFLAGATAKQAQAAVTSAYVLTHAGRHADSRKILEQVLPSLEESQTEVRYFAHQTLAKNFRELGELTEACEHLSIAIELAGDDNMARAFCLWSQAKLFERLGDVPRAMASYHEALPLLAKISGAGELAELAMEYGKLLFKEGKWPELQALTIDLAGWIQELRGTSKLRAVIDEFARLVEFNRLSEEAFHKILKRIQAAKAVKVPCTEVRST